MEYHLIVIQRQLSNQSQEGLHPLLKILQKCLKSCGNEKLCALVHHLVAQFERFRITALSLPGRMSDSVRQHSEIIEAFRKTDTSLVEGLVRANAERGRDVLVEELTQKKVQA